jgi:trk system potassium uptake protein TrkA
MADTRHFFVLGLGSFGSAMAMRLSENGCRVTGVDADPERVEMLKDVLYEAVAADTTDRLVLKQLGIAQASAVFISLGENIEPSLLATLHARELGARRILVKGVTLEHGKILDALGVERVIFPEVEMARTWADRVTWPNVLDFLPVDAEYDFIEMAVPDALFGKTLKQADLRNRYGIWVLGVKDALTSRLEILPTPDFRLSDDQMMLLIAKKTDMAKFRDLV